MNIEKMMDAILLSGTFGYSEDRIWVCSEDEAADILFKKDDPALYDDFVRWIDTYEEKRKAWVAANQAAYEAQMDAQVDGFRSEFIGSDARLRFVALSFLRNVAAGLLTFPVLGDQDGLIRALSGQGFLYIDSQYNFSLSSIGERLLARLEAEDKAPKDA